MENKTKAEAIYYDSISRFPEAWALPQYEGKTDYIMGMLTDKYTYNPADGLEPNVPVELTMTDQEFYHTHEYLYEMVDAGVN